MKQTTRLSSAVFQLTPTRTRCDLIIIANDKKEKIASGLINPFLAHLKTAQDQIAKGGYSILLEPTGGDAAWFTKATLERFVRFVSTPEILERVYTIETEILQIEEAIAIQCSSDIGQNIVENPGRKPLGSYEGHKSLPNANEEKAIVLYTPGTPLPEANGSCSNEGNSRVQLLKVLEARKTVLQKEQGMAFARAVAAGFDIDNMTPLVSFAECFGAMRLMEACSRFIDLWKSKHETGQWLDIEASEELSTQSDFRAINASGVILSGTPNKHDESNHELASENNGKSGSTNNADNQVPNGQQDHYHGQFPQLFFPPWPMHTPPGARPLFPAYPLQGMPYYQAYTGNGPIFHPHHFPMEHSPSNFGQPEMHSLDVGSKTREIDRTRSLDDLESDAEVSHSRKPHKRSGSSNTKQSGKVVIRNLNYITSKEKKSDSETNSGSRSDSDTENEISDGNDVTHQNKKRSSKNVGGQLKSVDNLSSINDEVSILGKDTDDRHWQAFQDCLLRGSDDRGERQDNKTRDMHRNNGTTSHRLRGSSDDVLFSSGDLRGSNDQTNIQFAETNGRKILSRRINEDFVIDNQRNQANFRNFSDPLAVNSFEDASNRNSSHGATDETLIVPFMSMSLDQIGGTDRNAVDIDSEIPSKYQKLGSEGNKNIVSYEPNDLSLMPERGTNKRSLGYDLAMDYEMQVCAHGSGEKGKKKVSDGKGGLSKSDRDRRSKITSDPLHKQRTGGPLRKAKPSKMSPLEDARARAEKLRSYKADLQKMKKEKEIAEAKRLESLKLERQKRIAARVGSNSVKRSTLSPQIKQLPAKLSATTNRGSKFSDSEPGSSSPLQRSKIRISVGSSESHKASKTSKLSEGSMAGNRLTRSSSSLSETRREKNGVTPDSKATISRIRRLSEPKTITNPPIATMKARSAEAVLKRKLPEGPERNKVSAIINLDRNKTATLPELKIKTSKSHGTTGENRSEVKDRQKVNRLRPSVFPRDTEVNVKNCNTAIQIDADDNPIVEKTVLVLQCEKPSLPTCYSSEGKPDIWSQQHNNRDKGEKSNMISESDFTHAPPPINGIVREPITFGQKQPDYNEVRTAYSEKDPPDVANITASGKPYQAPYARVSSLEDPCTHNTEYLKAPIGSSELLSRAEETVKTHVPDVKTLKRDKNQIASEKTSVKESSKGFKRLLKFGKKNHTSSSLDQSIDSECTAGDGIEHHDNAWKMASTSEVNTLKNLISQDEASTAGSALQKISRPFSLFSPFRSKASEKKQAT